MKFTSNILLFLVLLIGLSISSCDVTSSQIQTEEDQALFIRFENLTGASLESLQVDNLEMGDLEINTQTEYIEFDRFYLDAAHRPDLAVSTIIEGATYENVVVPTYSNPSMSGSCTTCSDAHYSPNGTIQKKITDGYYTITISANRSSVSETNPSDLRLTLGLSED